MNTATSETLIDSTVNPISAAPVRAAAVASMPASRWRLMFSTTTMASSTTNPVAIVRAIRLRLSRLYPSRYMTANVPTSDTGTATLGISVARQSRRKTEHDGDHQPDRDQQRDFDVADAGPDGRRAVHADRQRHGGRDAGPQLRQQGG